MKFRHLYASFLMFVFCTSCRQNHTNVPKDHIKYKTKDIVTFNGPTQQMIRNIKKGKNGDIYIAGANNTSFGDVFRYDGKSFTNLTSKLGSHRF